MTQLQDAVAFLREHAPRGPVYVHCKAGYSRSAAVAGAYLLATGRLDTIENALSPLRAVRPGIVIRSGVFIGLREFVDAPRLARVRAPA